MLVLDWLEVKDVSVDVSLVYEVGYYSHSDKKERDKVTLDFLEVLILDLVQAVFSSCSVTLAMRT